MSTETKKYSLPREFAEKWVAALRSGEFKQGKDAYYDKEMDCYCGSGLALIANGITEIGGDSFKTEKRLPSDFYKMKPEIIQMNDDLDYTFTDQADWIEANCQFTESEVSA